jgi:purine nucleosidase
VSRIPLIIDCDPGLDDAVALFLAFAAPDALELLAVTTVAGNVGAQQTARNARMLRQIAGREDVPVYAGAQGPLLRQPVEAGHFHGETGLGDLPLFEPDAPAAPGHAAQAIVDLVMARPPGAVSLVAIGPMTNVALAMALEPAIVPRLGRIVAMGGARREGGNITASSEYNIHADPHAAHKVIGSGVPVVLLGLDATHQVRATQSRIAAIRALGAAPALAIARLLDFSVRVEKVLVGWDAPPVHDPCTVAYLLAPELFVTRPAKVAVETCSPLTLGHTAVELRLDDPAAATVHWATEIDHEGVFALLLERLADDPR